MKQKDKDLLLRDLCARLPYGVKVGTTDNDGSLENVWDTLWFNTFTEDVKLTHSIEDADKIIDISETKPYLFPLSSMTEEQKREYEDTLVYHDYTKGGWTIAKTFNDEYVIPYWFVDFCNKNHLDYRGLIPKGLAIDCTNLNIY